MLPAGRCTIRAYRRHVMKGLLLLLGVGGGWQLWQSEAGEGLRADYRTAKGAVSHQRLEDGSLLTLSTQSAADVHFDTRQRAVHLWYGEIAITTAKTRSETFPRCDPSGASSPH